MYVLVCRYSLYLYLLTPYFRPKFCYCFLSNDPAFSLNVHSLRLLLSSTDTSFSWFKSDVSFWRELKRQGTRYPGTSDNTIAASSSTINTARKFLAEIYNVSIEGIPKPKYAMMSLWDSYPYGAAWYSYRAGYDWNKVCMYTK